MVGFRRCWNLGVDSIQSLQGGKMCLMAVVGVEPEGN